jgi:hypothetical protein
MLNDEGGSEEELAQGQTTGLLQSADRIHILV